MLWSTLDTTRNSVIFSEADNIHQLLQTGGVAAYEKLVAEIGTRKPEGIKASDGRAGLGSRP